jgi:hydrogenase maturation protease
MIIEPRAILVAAIGNPDRGDDGLGTAVAAWLRGRVPVGVRLLEYRGDILGLIDQWSASDAVVVIDAAASIGCPGRIHRVDLVWQTCPAALAKHSTHGFGVAEAVELSRTLGRQPRRLVAYLVEGESFDIGARRSPAGAAAVEQAAARVLSEITRLSQ